MNAMCKLCQQEFVKKYRAQLFCSLLCSNRFNLNNKNIVSISKKHSIDLAELFGILLGDGSVTKYYAKIYLNATADSEYVPVVKELAKRLFKGVPITCQQRIGEGTAEIQISSKDVCDYLKGVGFDPKERYIPLWILKNKNFAKATIRGLFDTEGSVGMKYFRGRGGDYLYKQLTVTNKNKNILHFLENFLTNFGYKPTKNSNKNIYLSNRLDVERYLKDIGCHNPKLVKKIKIKKVNGFIYGGLAEW